MAVAAFIVCGVTAFYTKRAEHGRTAEERQAYWIGEKAGEQAPRDAKLPTAAELNMMAQKYFKQQGSGQSVRLESGVRTRVRGRVHEDASAAVTRRDRQHACVTLLNEAVGEV
jgi:hypothetical protein